MHFSCSSSHDMLMPLYSCSSAHAPLHMLCSFYSAHAHALLMLTLCSSLCSHQHSAHAHTRALLILMLMLCSCSSALAHALLKLTLMLMLMLCSCSCSACLGRRWRGNDEEIELSKYLKEESIKKAKEKEALMVPIVLTGADRSSSSMRRSER